METESQAKYSLLPFVHGKLFLSPIAQQYIATKIFFYCFSAHSPELFVIRITFAWMTNIFLEIMQ